MNFLHSNNSNPSDNSSNNKKGLITLVVSLLLIGAVLLGVYLVRNPQIFKPKAGGGGPSLSLVGGEEEPLGSSVNPLFPGRTFLVNVLVDSAGQVFNTIDSKINFDQERLEVLSINTSSPGISEGQRFCGGVAGINCPKGYFCQITDPPNQSDRGGYCVRSKNGENPKIESVLNQLIRSRNRQLFAREHLLQLVDGKVRVVLELKNNNFHLDPLFGTEESRYETLLQALVNVDLLVKLSNDDVNIQYIRAPFQGHPDAQTSTSSGVLVDDGSNTTVVGGQVSSGSGGCRRTGCSGQICSDQDAYSTCEYREEYACYGNARCERQTNGSCGWTQTSELQQCLGGGGTKAEGEVCSNGRECKSGLVCDLGCPGGGTNCEAIATVCQQKSLSEGTRCDQTPNSCASGLECRAICEANPGGFSCDAVGSICKKKTNELGPIEATFNNEQGLISIYSKSSTEITANNLVLATIVFKALKPGSTTISFDNASALLSGQGNILANTVNLDLNITNGPDDHCMVAPNTPLPADCLSKGDGNHDGVLDALDLSIMLSNFFKNKPEFDFDNNGVINSIDYQGMLKLLRERGVIKVNGDNGNSCIEEKREYLKDKEFSPDSIIVGFNSDVSEQQGTQLVQNYQLTSNVIGQNFNSLRALSVNIPANQVAEWICKFSSQSIVKYAEENAITSTNN